MGLDEEFHEKLGNFTSSAADDVRKKIHSFMHDIKGVELPEDKIRLLLFVSVDFEGIVYKISEATAQAGQFGKFDKKVLIGFFNQLLLTIGLEETMKILAAAHLINEKLR